MPATLRWNSYLNIVGQLERIGIAMTNMDDCRGAYMYHETGGAIGSACIHLKQGCGSHHTLHLACGSHLGLRLSLT